jgi:hypothetical protein
VNIFIYKEREREEENIAHNTHSYNERNCLQILDLPSSISQMTIKPFEAAVAILFLVTKMFVMYI